MNKMKRLCALVSSAICLGACGGNSFTRGYSVGACGGNSFTRDYSECYAYSRTTTTYETPASSGPNVAGMAGSVSLALDLIRFAFDEDIPGFVRGLFFIPAMYVTVEMLSLGFTGKCALTPAIMKRWGADGWTDEGDGVESKTLSDGRKVVKVEKEVIFLQQKVV